VQDLFNAKMHSGEKMMDYLNRMEELHRGFIKAGNDRISDNLFAQLLIIGLTSDFAAVRTVVNTLKEKEQTSQNVRRILLAEADNRGMERHQS
jgi:hypothetical protein